MCQDNPKLLEWVRLIAGISGRGRTLVIDYGPLMSDDLAQSATFYDYIPKTALGGSFTNWIKYRVVIILLSRDNLRELKAIDYAKQILEPQGKLILFVGGASKNLRYRNLLFGLLKATLHYTKLRVLLSDDADITPELRKRGFVHVHASAIIPSITCPEVVFDLDTPNGLREALKARLGKLDAAVMEFCTKAILLLSRTRQGASGAFAVASGAGCVIHASIAGPQELWSELNSAISQEMSVSIKSACITSEKIMLLVNEPGGCLLKGVLKFHRRGNPNHEHRKVTNPFSPATEAISAGTLTLSWERWFKGGALSSGDKKMVRTAFEYIKQIQENTRITRNPVSFFVEYFSCGLESVANLKLNYDIAPVVNDALAVMQNDYSANRWSVAEHGDLVARNIINDHNGRIIILDADNWIADGFELLDPICLYVSFLAGEPTKSSVKVFKQSLRRGLHESWIKDLICGLYCVERSNFEWYVFLFIIRKIGLLYSDGRTSIAEYWVCLMAAYYEDVLRGKYYGSTKTY